MQQFKVKKRTAKGGPKTVSEKLHEQFAPKAKGHDEDASEDDATRPRFSEFDENDAELERAAGGRLSDIRKKNVRLLDAIDRKYQGQVSSRRDVFGEEEDEESEGEVEEEDDSDGEGYQPGAFVRMKPPQDSEEDDEELEDEDEPEGDFQDEEEDEDDDDEDDDEDDEEDEDDNDDFSLGDFLGGNQTESQKLLQDENHQESRQKGECVQNQLKLWERLLEMRIKMQSSLITSNALPHAEKFNNFCQDERFKEASETAIKTVETTLKNLLELQTTLVERFPESKDVLKSTSKRKAKDSPFGAKSAKVSRVQDYEPLLHDSYTSYKPYRNDVIQKWHDRTRTASSGKNAAHQSLNIVKKIENSLLAKDELIRKTQLYRGGYQLFGKPTATVDKTRSEENGDGEPEAVYDEEIFDDSDFYHALLRELIEYKSNTTENPQEINAKLAELQKLRNKMKKQVDTRASKGRKIRYVVHKKLVNFAAPEDKHEWTDEAKNELFSSLFGGISAGQE